MKELIWLTVIATSIWVYYDAKCIGAKRGLIPGFFGIGPLGWMFCCIGMWIISFPAYLIKREEIKMAAQGIEKRPSRSSEVEQGGLNKAAKFTAIGWSIFTSVGLITGLINVSKSAPISSSSPESFGFAIGTTIGMSMWLIIWAAIAIPASIVYLVTKRSGHQVVIEKSQAQSPLDSPLKTKKCPYCAELIREEAVFCRFCQKDINQEKKPENQSKRWVDKGVELINAGEYKEAVLAFSAGIKDEPTGDLHYARAVAYSKMHDREKSLSDLKFAAKLGNKQAADTLSRMGNV